MKTNRWHGFSDEELNHLYVGASRNSERCDFCGSLAEEIDKELERRGEKRSPWDNFNDEELRLFFEYTRVAESEKINKEIVREIKKRELNIEEQLNEN